MLPTTPNGVPEPSEPQLTDRTPAPRGVVQKNLKILLYLAAVAVLILATLVSSYKKKPYRVNLAPPALRDSREEASSPSSRPNSRKRNSLPPRSGNVSTPLASPQI
jgi:hypothetical protein